MGSFNCRRWGILVVADHADLDGDGDLDIVASYEKSYDVDFLQFTDGAIGWYENTNGTDQQYGPFRKLRTVWQASSLHIVDVEGDGDWNDDGEFDSGDLVAAFQAGIYRSE